MRDALADAETLRRVADVAPRPWLMVIYHHGRGAATYAARGDADHAADAARLAARKAFRAVPGLRGEP